MTAAANQILGLVPINEIDDSTMNTRAHLLSSLEKAGHHLDVAEHQLAHLRDTHGRTVDPEFAHGRDGHDVQHFIDEAIRNARAAYAMAHAVIENRFPDA